MISSTYISDQVEEASDACARDRLSGDQKHEQVPLHVKGRIALGCTRPQADHSEEPLDSLEAWDEEHAVLERLAIVYMPSLVVLIHADQRSHVALIMGSNGYFFGFRKLYIIANRDTKNTYAAEKDLKIQDRLRS